MSSFELILRRNVRKPRAKTILHNTKILSTLNDKFYHADAKYGTVSNTIKMMELFIFEIFFRFAIPLQ